MCSSRLQNCVVSVYLYMFSFCLLNSLLLLLCCVTCTPLNLRGVGALIPPYYNCSYLLCPFGQSVYHPFACLVNHTEQKPILVLKQHMWVVKFLKYIPRQISLTITNEKQTKKIWLCKVNRSGQNTIIIIQWNRDLSFRHRSFFRMYCSQFLVPN